MKHQTQQAKQLTRTQGEPRACYRRWSETAQRGGDALLVVDFVFHPYWLDKSESHALSAIYYRSGDVLQVAVTDQSLVADGISPRQQYLRWLQRHRLLDYTVGNPLQLVPQNIAKPWGQEIWYTAVERRGVCSFSGEGGKTPIPWLQAVLPESLAGSPGEALVLLKLLAPSAQPVLGDLYFELHEKKHEAYVVTHVDPLAWPDGIGFIRYGFDPLLRAEYGSDDAFRAAYLDSVMTYQAQRRKLDKLADEGGVTSPEELEREQSLRWQMERFTLMLPLRIGDVVQVPPLLPHALQHGVRTVEFQTPDYERKIISFAQKVLTQGHWDTREAVPHMLLQSPTMAPLTAPLVTLPAPDHVSIERIVDFPDFEVLRVRVTNGHEWEFEATDSYRLLIVVSGLLELSGARFQEEKALLLPHCWRGTLAAPEAAASLVFLLAKPRS